MIETLNIDSDKRYGEINDETLNANSADEVTLYINK